MCCAWRALSASGSGTIALCQARSLHNSVMPGALTASHQAATRVQHVLRLVAGPDCPVIRVDALDHQGHTRTHTRTHAHARTRTHAHARTRLHAHARTRTHTHAHARTRTANGDSCGVSVARAGKALRRGVAGALRVRALRRAAGSPQRKRRCAARLRENGRPPHRQAPPSAQSTPGGQ